MRTDNPAARAISPPAAAAGYSGVAVLAGSAVGPIALAILVTALPIVFHLAGQIVGIATCVALALIVANIAPAAVPITLVCAYLFQNLFVAMVSTQIGTIEELNSLRAYNFVLTVTMWAAFVAPFWLNRASYDRRFRLAMDVTTFVLIVIGIYFLVGVISDPSSAAAYLRNIAAPFLLFQIFALVAYRHRISMTAAFVLLAIVALIYGHLELFAHEQLLSLVNGDTYIKWRIKQ